MGKDRGGMADKPKGKEVAEGLLGLALMVGLGWGAYAWISGGSSDAPPPPPDFIKNAKAVMGIEYQMRIWGGSKCTPLTIDEAWYMRCATDSSQAVFQVHETGGIDFALTPMNGKAMQHAQAGRLRDVPVLDARPTHDLQTVIAAFSGS